MGKGRGGEEGDSRYGGGGRLKEKNTKLILHFLSLMEVIKANFPF